MTWFNATPLEAKLQLEPCCPNSQAKSPSIDTALYYLGRFKEEESMKGDFFHKLNQL